MQEAPDRRHQDADGLKCTQPGGDHQAVLGDDSVGGDGDDGEVEEGAVSLQAQHLEVRMEMRKTKKKRQRRRR